VCRARALRPFFDNLAKSPGARAFTKGSHLGPAAPKAPALSLIELLLDGALGDMVAVSTPRTGLDTADGEEGVWQTVRRAESHAQDDLNLWWSVDAGYLLDDVKKKAVIVTGSVEEDKEEEVEMSRRLLVAPPESSPAGTIGVEEEEEEAIISAGRAAAEEEEAVAPAAKRIRLFAYCSASQQKNWAGAVPAKKARRAPKKTIRKMRVALPVGDGDSATLANGALVYGMVGGKRKERCRLIAAARELRCAPEVWAREIEETLNDLIQEDAPLLSFGSGADDDVDLRNTCQLYDTFVLFMTPFVYSHFVYDK
jgi:hypothetical protein